MVLKNEKQHTDPLPIHSYGCVAEKGAISPTRALPKQNNLNSPHSLK